MIDEKLVANIAHLARIGVEEKELDRFVEELRTILGYVKMLDGADVSGIPDRAVVSGSGVLRSDEQSAEDKEAKLPNISLDLLEEQAPGHFDGEVRVPKVL